MPSNVAQKRIKRIKFKYLPFVIHVRMFTALHQMVTDAHGSLKKKKKKQQPKLFLVALTVTLTFLDVGYIVDKLH